MLDVMTAPNYSVTTDRGIDMIRERRAIRMNSEEWEAFKRLLGPTWLRSAINRAIKKDLRQPKAVEGESE